MSTIKKTASGKVDKRTKEYKELVERAKKARLAKTGVNKTTTQKSTTNRTSTVKRRSDGKVDLRTKEGKEIAERMSKARRVKNKGIVGLIKNLIK